MLLSRCISIALVCLAPLCVAHSLAAENALNQLSRERAESAARLAQVVVAVEGRTEARKERYYGAGTVVSSDGLILTSTTAVPQHVREILVTWADGTTSSATVVCSVHQTETVLLRVQKKGPFLHLPLASSASVTIGETVLAAGNPHETLRRDGQVFISGGALTGRYSTSSDDRASRYRGEVLETDAAVNPGCDGGPLVDARGRMIGLLSLCYTRTRWMGTAIPIERVLAALPQEEGVQLACDAKQVPTPDGIAGLLRHAAAPMATAVVRLEFRHAPEAELATAGATAPRAAAVTQQDAGALPLAIRPDADATGVLIEPRGTVLTSALNLEGVQGPVTVVLSDGRRYRAKPRGRHMDMDIAVLKVEGLKGSDPWPVAALVPTAAPRAGSFIGVLGAPPRASGEATFATGIVSALSRFDGLAAQIDAKTNYGNAGGPVMDLQGRCLGIVTHVGSRKCWGQSSGVGFFAPAEKVLSVLGELREGKTLRCPLQPVLGIAPAIGENDREGVKVGSVAKNSPAWRAGLREGDLITAADGQLTRSWSGLVNMLKSRHSKDEFRLQVLRGQDVVVVPVVLSEKD